MQYGRAQVYYIGQLFLKASNTMHNYTRSMGTIPKTTPICCAFNFKSMSIIEDLVLPLLLKQIENFWEGFAIEVGTCRDLL